VDVVDTPHGPAHVHLHEVHEPVGLLALGHGAGGGVNAPDLKAATAVANELGLTVALVEQPYRVAGRRSPAPAKQLDAAWIAVMDQIRMDDVPLIAGGRSAGARVACRTAEATGAAAVLCLAFPEHPPGKPEKSRQDELDAVEVPTLVVQGERDPFGRPRPTEHAEVVVVPGDHGLKADVEAVRTAIRDWLARLPAGTAAGDH
jgi:predicted alpha/beta-hydrolase family hydrolase